MDLLLRVNLTCFLLSYLVALIAEVAQFVRTRTRTLQTVVFCSCTGRTGRSHGIPDREISVFRTATTYWQQPRLAPRPGMAGCHTPVAAHVSNQVVSRDFSFTGRGLPCTAGDLCRFRTGKRGTLRRWSLVDDTACSLACDWHWSCRCRKRFQL